VCEAHLLSVGSMLAAIPFALWRSWQASCSLTVKLTCLSSGYKSSLGWLNLSLSVRKLPVMPSLTTTYVSLQVSFLLCRFNYGITKKRCSHSTSCFQILYLYILGDRMVYLLINKETENRGKYFWKYWSFHMLS
jgi:hypothetical protein